MNVPYLQYAYGGKIPERAGLSHPTVQPYGVYACSDGKELLISIQNEREWANFCADLLGDIALATDPRFCNNSQRVANLPAMRAIIEAAFAKFPREEIVRRLEKTRIAYGRVSTLEDVAKHPQNRYVEYNTPTGPVRCLAPGAIFDGTLPKLGAVPGRGEHSEKLRAEFGAAKS